MPYIRRPGHVSSTHGNLWWQQLGLIICCSELCGPCRGKTSVLFQYALQSAAEGLQVIFITPTLRQCPLLSAQMDHESPVLVESLRRISMKYIDTHQACFENVRCRAEFLILTDVPVQKLRLYVTSLHRMAHRPDILVIDGLSTICQR